MLQMALQGLYENFAKRVRDDDIIGAINGLKALDDEGLEPSRVSYRQMRQLLQQVKSADELIPLVAVHYGLTYKDAQNLIQACDKMLNDYCKENPYLSIEAKRTVLEFSRNTNLETSIKHRLCLDVVREAIRTQDKDALETACLTSDGLTPQDFNAIKQEIESSIALGGKDEANFIECMLLVKDSPSNAAQDFTIKFNNGEMSSEDYAKMLSDIEKNLPEDYDMTKDEIHNAMAREITSDILEANNTSMEFEMKIQNGEIVIEGKGNDYTLQFKGSDFETLEDEKDFIENNTNRSPMYDMINDMVSNPNLPPNSPEFVSELQQKVYSYLSELSTLPEKNDLEQEGKAVTALFVEVNMSSALIAIDSAYDDYHTELEQKAQEFDAEHDDEFENRDNPDEEIEFA